MGRLDVRYGYPVRQEYGDLCVLRFADDGPSRISRRGRTGQARRYSTQADQADGSAARRRPIAGRSTHQPLVAVAQDAAAPRRRRVAILVAVEDAAEEGWPSTASVLSR